MVFLGSEIIRRPQSTSEPLPESVITINNPGTTMSMAIPGTQIGGTDHTFLAYSKGICQGIYRQNVAL